MKLVGERKALGAFVFAAFAGLFLLNALLLPPQFKPMMFGLVAIYGAAYFGLVAGWFWARWFASGVAFSGLAIAVMMAVQVGLEPIVWIWGGAHLAAFACLLGEGPRAQFEGRTDWRQRFRLDEGGVTRLGKSVQRAGASLPYLVMAALGPKEGSADLIALALGVAGVIALLRLRTWGVLALAGAACLSLFGALSGSPTVVVSSAWSLDMASGLAAALALTLAVAPMARPIARSLFARAS
jgi:hypothetical protein